MIELHKKETSLKDLLSLVARGVLTVDLIDEIKVCSVYGHGFFSHFAFSQTATGTAIDIPIDALAGQVDDSPLGGNSSTASGALLTLQQAVNIKAAIQEAIANVCASFLEIITWA